MWDYFASIVTPTTIVAIALVGVAYGVFLWRVCVHVHPLHFVIVWTAGSVFCVCLAASRWVDNFPQWPVWFGAGALWTWFVGWAALSVGTWRHVVRGRHPEHERRNPV
jgi:hypothetical protein